MTSKLKTSFTHDEICQIKKLRAWSRLSLDEIGLLFDSNRKWVTHALKEAGAFIDYRPERPLSVPDFKGWKFEDVEGLR